MLTRLQVTGFKNLMNVDVRFSPFTCICGANGTGKSNLFDAIRFISLLADHTLRDAAFAIRSDENKAYDIESIFYHQADKYKQEMEFIADMIISAEGVDDLGQPAQASTTMLRYTLKIGYKKPDTHMPDSMEILHEELTYLKPSEIKKNFLFKFSDAWKQSALIGKRTSPFISTEIHNVKTPLIKLHQEQRKGRAYLRKAADLPRTMLSSTNSAESPTALLVKREMQSWRLLQFEPVLLRKPDEINAPSRLSADGAHLPATLYRLARAGEDEAQVYGQVALRLAELIEDIKELRIEKDEKRELLTLYITDFRGTEHAARALSDGTLRFLALAILEADGESKLVLCLEEPENGIHPARIKTMLTLLKDIACDLNYAVSQDNPLRQVIINTHSPVVVQEVDEDSLLCAITTNKRIDADSVSTVAFKCLPRTWRAQKANCEIIQKADMVAYLEPVIPADIPQRQEAPPDSRRVIDSDYVQGILEYFRAEE